MASKTWANGGGTGTYSVRWQNEKRGQSGKLSKKDLVNGFIPIAYQQWNKLMNTASENGIYIGYTGIYRSYASQVSAKKRKPKLCATPGNSNHGWGRAIDISILTKQDKITKFKAGKWLGIGYNAGISFNHPFYIWMFNNAWKFGWVNPPWATKGNRRSEPWHWEFVGFPDMAQVNPAIDGSDTNQDTFSNTQLASIDNSGLTVGNAYVGGSSVADSDTGSSSSSSSSSSKNSADLFAELNEYLLTGQGMADSSITPKDGQKTKTTKDEGITVVSTATHEHDKIVLDIG